MTTLPRSPARPSSRAPFTSLALAASLAASLAGCGGGGSGDGDAGGFTLGGAVTGLAEGRRIVLQNQGTDDLVVTANGSFTLGRRLAAGSAYAIAIQAQPAGQQCSVAQGTGTLQANVADVAVHCATLPAASYTVGGQVTGLPAGARLVLQNNQGDDLALTANGRFTFATALASGSAYAVTVPSQPAGQTCTVGNGSAAVAGAHVDSVQVVCTTAVWGMPEGDWGREGCDTNTTGQGTRSLWRITRQDETHATITLGTKVYANPQCAGPGTVQSDREYARFEVDRKETRGTITAFWGHWIFNATPNNPTRAVFSRSGPYLCRGIDHFWAQYPTMDVVEERLQSSITSGMCYLQVP